MFNIPEGKVMGKVWELINEVSDDFGVGDAVSLEIGQYKIVDWWHCQSRTDNLPQAGAWKVPKRNQSAGACTGLLRWTLFFEVAEVRRAMFGMWGS